MSSPRCLVSSATALRRVFINNVIATPAPSFYLQRLLTPRLCITNHQTRSFQIRRTVQTDPDAAPRTKVKLGRLPRDQEIRDSFVVLRGEDGKLSEPTLTRKVLDSLNPKVESLLVVVPAGKQVKGGSAGGGLQYPICRVVNRQEARAAQEEKAKAARKKAVQTKEIELNWAIAPNDLEHRLRQFKGFLEKGLRVQVVLMRKRRKGSQQRRASREEAEELVKKVKETIAEVKGARETATSKGTLLETYRFYTEGPAV